jgi:hypothetical protein
MISSPRLRVLALALAAALGHTSALASSETEQLRAEFEQKLKALQDTYDARLKELEARIAARPEPSSPGAAPAAVARPAASGFNPEVSLVLQGAYVSQKDLEERHLAGFAEAGHDHGGGRGFRLDHTELVMSANVDPYFRGHANFALADGEVEIEEAWVQTLGLGHGLTVRGGRFLSGLGYSNEQHPHAWDFADQSLMYRALFGEHLVQDGVQLKWLAPTATFLEFGLEAARGQFFPGSEAGGNRSGAGALAAFAKIGGDLGASHSWRAGINFLHAKPKLREAHFEDVNDIEAETLFSGHSKTWIADFVWKWAPEGNARERHFKFQAEVFRRRETGEFFCADNSAEGGACLGLTAPYRSAQSGGYVQGVWQFLPGWRVGYRYDRLDPGSVDFGENPLESGSHKPIKHSLMFDYSPSEFSRFRLQWARDQSMAGVSDRQLTLQYIHSLGAHGAHKF